MTQVIWGWMILASFTTKFSRMQSVHLENKIVGARRPNPTITKLTLQGSLSAMKHCMFKSILIVLILVAFAPLAFCQAQLLQRWELQNTNVNLSDWWVAGIGNDNSCVI